MRIDTFTVVMAVLLCTSLVLAVRILRRRDFFLRTFGVHTVLSLYLLCALRMALPVEFPFTIQVGVPAWDSLAAVLDTPLPRAGWNVEQLLTAVWLTGAAVSLLVFGLREITLSRYLRRYPGGQNALAEAVLDNIRQTFPRRLPVQVRVYQGLTMPVGVGLLHPLICLPDRDYTAKELSYILRHEYTHFLGRDLQIKLLVRLYVCLFWWNPAAWLLPGDIGQVLELRCDRAVTRDFTLRERREYLTVILSSILNAGDTPGLLPVSTRLGSSRVRPDMLERFRMVADPGEIPGHRHTISMAGSALLFAGSYAFLFQPTDAANRFTLPDGMVEVLLLLAIGGGAAIWAWRKSKRTARMCQRRLGALVSAAAVLVTGLGVYQMGFQAGQNHAVSVSVTSWDGRRSSRIAIDAERFDSLTSLDVHDVLCTSEAIGVSAGGPCQYHFDLIDCSEYFSNSQSEFFLKGADTAISAANCLAALRAVSPDRVTYEPGMGPEFLEGGQPLCGVSERYAQLTGLRLGDQVSMPIYTAVRYTYGAAYHYVGWHTFQVAAMFPSGRVNGCRSPDMIIPADWLREVTEGAGFNFYYSSLSAMLDDRQVEQVWDAGFVPVGTERNPYLSNNTLAIHT